METQKTNENNQLGEQTQRRIGNLNCKIDFELHTKVKNEAWINKETVAEVVERRLKQAYNQEQQAA